MSVLQTIAAALVGTLIIMRFFLAGSEFLMYLGVIIGIAAAAFTYVMIGVLLKSAQKQQQIARETEDKRFENGEMSPAEREAYVKRKLDIAQRAYDCGQLTLLEYDLLRKKYTGKSNFIDDFGLGVTMAASNKNQVDIAIAQHKKDAERSFIISAAAGNAIGGTAGAVIGAATSAQISAQEAAELEKQRVAAEQKYHQAIEDSVKR